MSTISASEARKSLFPLIAEVNEDHSVVRITSKAGNAVIMSEEDFEALQTSRYLFSTAANAQWLLESFQQSEKGELAQHELIEE